MKRPITGPIAMFTVFVAVCAVLRPAPSNEFELVDVAVAASELQRGHVIAPGDLEWVSIPRIHLDPVWGCGPRGPQCVPADALLGRVVSDRVLPRETLRDERLVDREDGRGLTVRLSPGRVASSLKTSGDVSWLGPDDLVSLVYRYEGGVSVIPGIHRVLGVLLDPADSVVVLEVDVDDALALTLANSSPGEWQVVPAPHGG